LNELDRATDAWEQGLALFRADGHIWGMSVCSGYLGLLAIVSGDLAEAAAYQRRSLDLRWAVGPRADFNGCLSDAALLSATGGNYQEAARLFGAVEALRATAGGNWRLPERLWYERALDESRAVLGSEAFEAAFAAGRALSLPDAAAAASAAIERAAAVPSPIPAGTAVTTTAVDSAAPVAGHREPHGDGIELTPREIEVLRMLATGRSTPEIAAQLFISPRTVTTHVGNLMAKLDVDTRAAAVAYAFRHGLV
jgi:DNA-binding CsgD family transcriptional regulator